MPAGIGASFAEGASAIGAVTSTVSLRPGESQSLQTMWAPDSAGLHDLTVMPLGSAGGRGTPRSMCSIPPPTHLAMSVRDLRLYEDWNLVAAPVQTDDDDVQVVQRGIAGDYTAILGYEEGIVPYYPDRPQDSTLTAVEPGRGYWVRITSTEPLTGTLYEEPLATWRMAGEELAVDQDLPLAAGWNLTSYLPQASLPVTAALQSIDGAYAAVLGFERTGLSYYPDLSVESGYNTLQQMKPAAGYWIHATGAITLHYPPGTDTPEWSAPTLTDTIAYSHRLDAIRLAEEAAGVRPTYTWLNLYGRAYLADHSLAPVGTTVTALANGVACGATVITDEGRFGLLACYGDDQSTPEVDGARAGDAITLLLNGEPVDSPPIGFNGQGVEGAQPVLWTGHGDRWEVQVGEPYRFLLPMVMVVPDRCLLPILMKAQ